MWTLLARPDVLTREYFMGRRARWISPIRLYLVSTLAYYGLTALMDPEDAHLIEKGGRLMILLVPVFALLIMAAAKGRRHFPPHGSPRGWFVRQEQWLCRRGSWPAPPGSDH